MSDNPEKLVLKILVRLPTKSLLRFRSVCKSWSLLISSPNFISSHKLHNQSTGNYNLLFRCFTDKEIYTLFDEKCRSSALRTFRKTIGELDFPFYQPLREYYTVVGCVDGLICLWDETYDLVTLWNPAIRKSYPVPYFYGKPSDITSRTYLKCSFGFGFDALANDYKILRIAFWFHSCPAGRRVDREPFSYRTKPFLCSADIFSLSTKSWRSVKFSMLLQQLSVPVFVNGALHFLTRKDSNQCCIVSFSLNVETFVEMACPQGGKLNANLNHQIAGSSGTIFLFHQLPENQYDIWVMKEYNVKESWTKLFSINLNHGGRKQLISVTRNGGLIICGKGSWIGYPIVEDVEVADLRPLKSYIAAHAEFYSESLVLLGNDDCVTYQQRKNEKKNAEARIRQIECTCRLFDDVRMNFANPDVRKRLGCRCEPP